MKIAAICTIVMHAVRTVPSELASDGRLVDSNRKEGRAIGSSSNERILSIPVQRSASSYNPGSCDEALSADAYCTV